MPAYVKIFNTYCNNKIGRFKEGFVMDDRQKIRKSYVKVNGRYSCMLYEPALPGEKSSVGIVLMHTDADYFDFWPAIALSERGYRVIVSNAMKDETSLDGEIKHLAAVVSFIRGCPGIEKVVLLGHSGGATLATAYQAIAENGQDIFKGPEMNIAVSDVGDLVPADAVMLLDPNFGNGAMTLLSLDPAVNDDPRKRDPKLDIYDPANGYSRGECTYSDEFLKEFWKAQGRRMNDLVDWARERVIKIDRGEGRFRDDEPLVIPGASQAGFNNKIMGHDVKRVFAHTKGEWPLIHRDGGISVETVYSVRPARPGRCSADQLKRGAYIGTVKEFLQSSSTRVDTENYGMDETTLHGVDWDASYCCTVGNVKYIHVPMLFMGMTGSYEYIAAEHAYDRAVNCDDKTMAFVEGAGHNFEPVKADGPDPDIYGDTVRSCFDYVDGWLAEKFIRP